MINNKKGGIKGFIVLIMLIVLVGFILFIVYQSQTDEPVTTVKTNQTIDDIDLGDTSDMTKEEVIELAKQKLIEANNLQEEKNYTIWWIIGFVIGILIIVTIAYLYFGKKDEEKDNTIKKPVPINKVKQIFKEAIAKEYGLQWYIDIDGNFQLKNKNDFYYMDQRVFYHRQTGNQFLLIDFVVNYGLNFGVHIGFIPSNNCEEI